MVLILDGNSDKGVHVYLICLTLIVLGGGGEGGGVKRITALTKLNYSKNAPRCFP